MHSMFELFKYSCYVLLYIIQQETKYLHLALNHFDSNVRLMAFTFLSSSQQTTGMFVSDPPQYEEFIFYLSFAL